VAGSPFNNAGLRPAAITVDPAGKFAIVADFNSANVDNVTVYSINQATGALSSVSGSPFAAETNPYSVAVDPAGKFIFTANYGSNKVSAFAINSSTGLLAPVTGSPFVAGIQPESITVDPSGKFVFVANFGSN